MATWLEDVILALENLGGVGNYSQIYHEVQLIRDDMPKSWKAIIRRTIETYSSDSEAFNGNYNNDIFYSVEGIGNGVWGLRTYNNKIIVSEDYSEYIPDRTNYNVERIIRDSNITKYLKNIHNNKCQICGISLELGNDKYYSEAHHIKPLGKSHNGPDVIENIIIVCPNHHALLDYGAIRLLNSDIYSHPNHKIDQKFIDYHNKNIYK